MYNLTIYEKKKELMEQVNKIVSTRTVDITFNKKENYFFCSFSHSSIIDYCVYIHIDEKICYIGYNGIEGDLKQSFTRWFNVKGKDLFTEMHKLLKLLTPSEQSDFDLCYYI